MVQLNHLAIQQLLQVKVRQFRLQVIQQQAHLIILQLQIMRLLLLHLCLLLHLWLLLRLRVLLHLRVLMHQWFLLHLRLLQVYVAHQLRPAILVVLCLKSRQSFLLNQIHHHFASTNLEDISSHFKSFFSSQLQLFQVAELCSQSMLKLMLLHLKVMCPSILVIRFCSH